MPRPQDTIDRFGYPLGFKVRHGTPRAPGPGTGRITVEARALTGHQKEAVVTEGDSGSQWRLTSDEGAVMKGDDLAPFPLGFFIAGVTGDLARRLHAAAAGRGLVLTGLRIGFAHDFGASGSFIASTARATSEAARIGIEINADVTADEARALVGEALDNSPAIALLRVPMLRNGFALYINGQRRTLADQPNPPVGDAADPFRTYASPPRPLDPAGPADLLEKTGAVETGAPPSVPLATTGTRVLTIAGTGQHHPLGFATETWIARPGMSHFRLLTGDGASDAAPSGLALLSAGIAFCYLTQLARYIDAQKLPIHGARLVQHSPYTSGPQATAGPIDTHLFLNGAAPEALHLKLLTIAAQTCFMHAAATGSVEPAIDLRLNGTSIR